MELLYTSLQRMQLSPILINTQFFSNVLYHIVLSFYVRLQNEVLNCNFPTKVLKEHSFFLMFINFCPLLSAFANCGKLCRVCPSFRLSVHMEHLGYLCTDFHEI